MSPISSPDNPINSEETSNEHLDEGQNLYDQPPFISFTQKMIVDNKFVPNNIYAAMTVITELLERDLRDNCDMNVAIRNFNSLTSEEKENKISSLANKFIYAQRREVFLKTSRELRGISAEQKVILLRSVINFLLQDVYQIFYIKEQLADAKFPINGKYHHTRENLGFGIPTFANWKAQKEAGVNETPVPENLEGIGPAGYSREPNARSGVTGYASDKDKLASSEIAPNKQTN